MIGEIPFLGIITIASFPEGPDSFPAGFLMRIYFIVDNQTLFLYKSLDLYIHSAQYKMLLFSNCVRLTSFWNFNNALRGRFFQNGKGKMDQTPPFIFQGPFGKWKQWRDCLQVATALLVIYTSFDKSLSMSLYSCKVGPMCPSPTLAAEMGLSA